MRPPGRLGLFSLAILIPLILQAQDLSEGKRLYDVQCQACHGEDAHGSDRAPELSGSRRLRSRSTSQIREIIRKGIPEGGMPPFDLPAAKLDDLAALIRSLNSPAAENPLPGDPVNGEQFFFGKGQCAACHMVAGKGKPIGPDLSSVGRELTAPEIQRALLNPTAHITPGYEFITVKLRDGQTLSGFARNRSDFDLQLQDLEGHFHLLRPDQIASVQSEKQSPMPPLKTDATQLRDLVAFLGHLNGVKPGNVVPPGESGGVTFARILNPKGEWLTYNGNLSANRYSELNQLTTANVSRLAVKWIFSVPHFGVEATPLVADGVMYFTGPNQSYAIDAVTGRQIWHYARPMTPGLIGDASLGTNKGMAILGDKVFQVTDNAHLIALNRTTGQLVWEAVMPEEPMHYGSTVAPLIVKDLVIAGVSGGDRGIRGFLSAYKASTGERVWRRWTVPAKGDPGIETWQGSEPKQGGGATWLTGSYDPQSDTLFWATGNPYPDSDDHDRPGDNLYSNCVLALDPATGVLKWHYQFTPHDVHDWDATEPNVLVDTKFKGQDRKLLLHADRNGFFYVLDRTNGKVLVADKFVRRLTWATGIGPDGRPQMLPDGPVVCPAGEATNYNSTAFSPVTHLYYLMALDSCRAKRPPQPDPPQKYLRAIDIETGKIAWENPLTGSTDSKRWSGVLATAGGLLFYGDPVGDFAAVDARDGKPLWHFVTNQTIKAAPMTYSIDGKQYIALAAGSDILCFALP
jgi:PQQ-dependent dehydrogenase (methanol/ethanol family)